LDQGLTRRELDVVNLLVKGQKNSQIASALFISEYTVDNHLKSIYRKMSVKNRTSLVYSLLQMDHSDIKLDTSYI
jgi:DNA-binding NarL/FixJ family response regulator